MHYLNEAQNGLVKKVLVPSSFVQICPGANLLSTSNHAIHQSQDLVVGRLLLDRGPPHLYHLPFRILASGALHLCQDLQVFVGLDHAVQVLFGFLQKETSNNFTIVTILQLKLLYKSKYLTAFT